LAAVRYAEQHEEDLAHLMDQDRWTNGYKAYLRQMRNDGEWGDVVMLTALCGAYKVGLAILHAQHEGGHFWVEVGEVEAGERRLGLYYTGDHYENLIMFKEMFPAVCRD